MACAKCFGGDQKHQFLLLGLDGAGKTTLFWRLKGWKWDDLLKDVQKMRDDNGSKNDAGYHYEEFTKSGVLNYGMWDIPGSPSYRLLWPTFYRYVRMSAVIFMVDAVEAQETDEYVERVEETKQIIEYLLAEDELRTAAFIVIINDKRYKANQKDKDGNFFQDLCPPDYAGYDDKTDILGHMLGLRELEAMEHNKRRMRTYIRDVAEIDGEDHDDWNDILEDIQKIIIALSSE